ncbi:class I SAM-dependent methyltransferase [Saccharopolyspora sp. ASAGF58]|uniref:class I SAM-dependent methyltransferase n=1 Tax=Saccharopolyspora sp. ASAGF58 TaxID=2719023 RepID=UPI001447DD01|nr:class I SAM-dependent methyltransferase [Saccharopolyspora sp. ASAGF58]
MTETTGMSQNLPGRTNGAARLPRTGLAALLAAADLPGEIELPCGSIVAVGVGEPRYRMTFRSESALRAPLTELAIGQAFVSGDIDVEGDLGALFGIRTALREEVPMRQRLRFLYDFLRSPLKMNKQAVSAHYGRGDDFYLTFIDKLFRFYSQGLFQHPGETIEEASEHKLETMFAALDLQPGVRLLDIGGGWGGVTQYCGERGVHVTTLTIAEDSANHVRALIADNDLPGEVLLEDFLAHRPVQPYDHAVIYGVIEHLPNYRRFAAKAWDVLKPGGRLYLDASASIQKFSVSSFTRDHIWGGTHTYMTLQDVIAEMLYHGFEVLDVTRETRDYELTMLEWAKRLDAAKDDVVARWGEETYRAFRLFLWGGTHAFNVNALQAYHLVVERTADPGPRPSRLRRLVEFLAGLR